MPWVAHATDASDSHKIWTHPGSKHEDALRHIGWKYEVPAPGSVEPPEQPAEPVSADPSPVVEEPAPEPKKRGGRG